MLAPSVLTTVFWPIGICKNTNFFNSDVFIFQNGFYCAF